MAEDAGGDSAAREGRDRANMRAQAFYRRVTDGAGRLEEMAVRRATAAVLQALRDRLTPAEAEHVVAQLPAELKAVWREGDALGRTPTKMHTGDFYDRVWRAAELGSREDARMATVAVFAALKEQLSPGEAEDVLAQLPADLKAIWREAPARAVSGMQTIPVERVMTARIVMIFEDIPMAEARAMAAGYEYNAFPVVTREGRLVGVVSKGDVLRAVRASVANPNVWQESVSRWMAHRVLTLHRRDSIATAVALMSDSGFRSLPVVDEGGRVVGMVSRTDLVRAVEGGVET